MADERNKSHTEHRAMLNHRESMMWSCSLYRYSAHATDRIYVNPHTVDGANNLHFPLDAQLSVHGTQHHNIGLRIDRAKWRWRLQSLDIKNKLAPRPTFSFYNPSLGAETNPSARDEEKHTIVPLARREDTYRTEMKATTPSTVLPVLLTGLLGTASAQDFGLGPLAPGLGPRWVLSICGFWGMF